MTTTQERVSQTINDYVAACNAGDTDAFMATIAKDVVFMPPDHPIRTVSSTSMRYSRRNVICAFKRSKSA